MQTPPQGWPQVWLKHTHVEGGL